MATSKEFKLAEKIAAQQQEVIEELTQLVVSIERCEKTAAELQAELEKVNARHQNRKTTQEDIYYLEDLLKCAHKKLGWEKQLSSLKKRTPPLMEKVSEVVNHPQAPTGDEGRAAMLTLLEKVQASLGRMQIIQ